LVSCSSFVESLDNESRDRPPGGSVISLRHRRLNGRDKRLHERLNGNVTGLASARIENPPPQRADRDPVRCRNAGSRYRSWRRLHRSRQGGFRHGADEALDVFEIGAAMVPANCADDFVISRLSVSIA